MWRTIVTVAILALKLASAADVAFMIPKGAYNMTDLCCCLPDFKCTAVFGNAAYGETELSNEAIKNMVSAITNTTAAVSRDVLQDATPGTLYPAEVQPFAPKADIAFAYDAGGVATGVRALKQLSVPTLPARIQLNAPYHLPFLNAKQRVLCQLTQSDCQFRDNAYVFSKTGKGVRVYSMGEAINERHVEFITPTGANKVITESFKFDSYSDNETCSRWQGTHLAALIGGNFYGVAKDVELVSVAVKPGCRGVGSARALAEGLWWVTKHIEYDPSKAVVVVDAKVSTKQQSSVIVDIIDQLVNDLIDMGVVVVATSGASRVDACDFTPGRVPRAITAAGAEVVQLPSKMVGRPWLESNAGLCVDIWAPGALIESAFSPGTEATAVYSGTTPASAMVAGAMAILMETYPDYSIESLKQALMNASSTGQMIYTRPNTTGMILQVPVM